MTGWLLTTLTLLYPPTGEPPPAAAPVATADAEVHEGRVLLDRFECNRCHDGAGMQPAPQSKHCVSCHDDILAGRFEAPAAALAKWKEAIVDLTHAPSLEATGERLRREWLVGFLVEPHDVRPRLSATMPRMPIDRAQAEAIARYLVPKEAPPADLTGADPARGRKLLDTRGCGQCHAFTGVTALKPSPPKPGSLSEAQTAAGMLLAPDLRFTRDRFQSGALVKWIHEPRAIKPDSPMPTEGLSEAEARDIAAYVMTAELAPEALPPVPARLPPLAREVGYDEVERVVLRHTCWHCHSEPDAVRGDGGPGNTGGFGFKGRGVILSDYSGVMSGWVADDGQRHSLFEAMEDGTPRLVASLWARHEEVAGKPRPGLRGMPLGLPPLPPEQIQLVESWIAQGRPQ